MGGSVVKGRRPTSSDGGKAERRKNHRFPVAVPLEASWCGPDGKAVKADAVGKQVNTRGGFLEMANYPEVGSRITLTNFLSAVTAEARVLATPSSREGVSQGIIVELVVPNDDFWGVDLQVRKSIAELHHLEESLLSEGIDLRLLAEFRDAVEFLRTAGTVVQRLRERQLQGRDDEDVQSLLSADRVRRATRLCLEIVTDVDSGKVHCETKGADELYRSFEQACDRLRRLLKPRTAAV
jgi:hypothetical protein